ncbi:phage holin family protein [Streptacidiphilus sp. ASG 303]|uniref:phage holin family protein n=1 Tax=Streptomycetaceae TaxID=2062 RepID=UPI001E45A062|nr:phage holin family protein [Streptacidiphilus sp. ASG 303]MCD0482558.1 phage holin family protein [Streptacidiphilus sp. ASG 303]
MARTQVYEPATEQRGHVRGADRASVGELVGELGRDMSLLVRQEMALARMELKQEAAKAGKGAGMLGGAGYAGHMLVLFGSLAGVFGLAHVMDIAWAALVVTGVWALVAGVLFLTGRRKLHAVHPKPQHTMETLKEDAQWARHPRS